MQLTVDNGQLPVGWEMKKWGSVLEIKNGRNQSKVTNPDGQYPIYGSGGIMGYANEYICNEGTTIIGRKGSINNPIYVSTKFWNVDTAFGLSPLNALNGMFLYYFCLGYNFKKHDRGTTLPSLTKADLLNVSMPIPPLPEQKQIVAILDEAFEGIDKAIANAEKNLANARELFESYRNSILTQENRQWQETKLGAEIDLMTGFPFKSNRYTDSDQSIRLLRGDNIVQGALRWDDVKKWPESEINESKRAM
jgi:type I restriction enzyme S subunit